MPAARGRVLRPLLGLPRTVLHEYARSRQLAWIEDESNADSRYTRNFLRREILPAIASRFPAGSGLEGFVEESGIPGQFWSRLGD